MEENNKPGRTEADIRKMLKPYRQWSGAQKRKTNETVNNKDGDTDNNTNNEGSCKGAGAQHSANKGKGKGKGAGSVPNPASEGKPTGKGKGITAFLGDILFPDAHLPIMKGFTAGDGEAVIQIHTDDSNMDMTHKV